MLSTKESTILTNHAAMRMASRGIKQWQVNQVMQYGRISYVRSSTIYAIGKKEINRNQDMKGLKL